jgi:hypothetical protein
MGSARVDESALTFASGGGGETGKSHFWTAVYSEQTL